MFMKIQPISERNRKSMAAAKIKRLKINGVEKTCSSLLHEGKPYTKMKVEPGMLMKIKGLKNGFGKNLECYR